MNTSESFVLGVLVGAVAGLLLAPRSGAETRKELVRAIEKGKDRLKEVESKVEVRITGLLDDIQEKTNKLLEAGSEMAGNKRQDLLDAIQVAKRALAEEKEILMRMRRQRNQELEPVAESGEEKAGDDA